MKQVLLSGKGVCRAFAQGGSKVQVLDNIDVNIYEGDFTIIMGASGAGKSTLLYALSGMDEITGGSVSFQGKRLDGLSEKKMAGLRAQEFGFIFQQTHLVSNLTLLENVAVAGCAAKAGTVKEVREKAETLLEKMNVAEAKDRMPSQVSGGEAQRAAIARAMIGAPKLLFADEPTGALNRANSEVVMEILATLNRKGQSILMVTHDTKTALFGNRILYLEDGKIFGELSLPPYGSDDGRDRERKVNEWLSGMHW